ncbi:ARF-binding protein [Rhizina undulata]
MAARDRFGSFPAEPSQSQLQRYIQNACDPANFEPNLALNLEIADLIKQKKGNAPREAAVAIVNYINHRNPNVALLSLALLDICVKNCGYPFHLQISTKDFLNDLVRRFPEKPPVRPTRVQLKILEAIEEWRATICQTSRYKEDLGFIRDMHRLLSYKGYVFPEVRREDAAVLNQSDTLKSAEEMEEEERAAQSAKLQELIRRGTPADLQEANHLMKIMAGYDQASKTDYRAKAAEDLAKLRQKAKLLEEMLGRVNKGETIGQQDAFEDLANALRTAQPKIQKMVEEESHDPEAVVKLLDLNDVINTTIERYQLVKKGDLEAARKLPPTATVSPPAHSEPSTSSAAAEISLIDLDNDTNGGAGAAAAAKSVSPSFAAANTGSLEDDLLGLSFNNSNAYVQPQQSGGIALGFGANTGIPGPPLISSTIHSNTASQQQLRQTPTSTPAPSSSSVSPPPQYNPSSFSNPSNQQTNFMGMFSPENNRNSSNNNEDDEWAFSSALPPGSEPQQPPPANELVILNSNLGIVLEVGRNGDVVVLKARFSNLAAVPLVDLTFQMAVTKAFSLKMEPQTGRYLPPNQKDGITQIIRVSGVLNRGGAGVKMRWKASFKVGGGALVEEQGVIEGLPIV